jgi:rhodanese-related sulfurtransferase
MTGAGHETGLGHEGALDHETSVDPARAAELLASAGFTYLDVRSEPEFYEGRPKGAVNVPLQHMMPEGMVTNVAFVKQVRARFALDAKLIVGCKAGGRSRKAVMLLREAGFRHVIDQRAGFDGLRGPFGEMQVPGWGRVGLPVESG